MALWIQTYETLIWVKLGRNPGPVACVGSPAGQLQLMDLLRRGFCPSRASLELGARIPERLVKGRTGNFP